MRDLTLLDAYRLHNIEEQMGGNPDPAFNGVFMVPSPTGGGKLRIIASIAYGWEHVSVSLPNRCPNWPEMSAVKDLFFRHDEWVLQYHPAKSDYVNNMPYCLHMWRPLHQTIPVPPSGLVGIKGLDPAEAAAMSEEERARLVGIVASELKRQAEEGANE